MKHSPPPFFSPSPIELKPYKYAGYPMLITTIQRETTDDDLFSKSAPILTAASEVAFHTMNTSSLNAEELRREEGIAVRSFCISTCIWGGAVGMLCWGEVSGCGYYVVYMYVYSL